jgi:WD40 repeat protein
VDGAGAGDRARGVAHGKRLATGDAGGEVRVWDVTRRAEVVSFAGHAKVVTAVAFTRDGRRVVSAAADQAVRVWSVP